jgi:DNA-binding Xre family transcriptional regulator
MIRLRIAELCREKGIKPPLAALKKAGISAIKGRQYLAAKTNRLMVDDSEKLCRLLRCTPNDLLEWTPDNAAEDYAENPLQAIRKKPSINIEEKLKSMTLEEVREKFGTQSP